MKKKKIDLLALSETRWSGHWISQIHSTTILHCGSSNGHHGVAIALSPSARSSWEAAGSVFHPISECIICIRLKCHLSYVSVIAVYAPTNPSSNTVQAVAPSDAFYDQLQSVVAAVPPRDMLLFLGDFNARVGTDFQSWRSVIGPHGMGDCNHNGERLLDFCANNQLLVTNTWFKHKNIHKATWFHNGDRSRRGHIIDYVLVNRRFRTTILDTRVYHSVLHDSDHELVVSTLRFKIKTRRRQVIASRRQTTNLSADLKSQFRSHLSDSFMKSPPDVSIESSWSSFKSAIEDACSTLPEVPSARDPDWVTDELRNLSKKKSSAWLRYRNAAKQGYEVSRHRVEYKRYCSLTKVAAEKARNAWWTACAVEAEKRAWVAEQLGHGGSLIKELRLLKKHFSKPSSSTLSALDGSLLTTDSSKLERWAAFC